MRYVIRLGIFDRGQAEQTIDDVEFATWLYPYQKSPGLAHTTEMPQSLPRDDLPELLLGDGRGELDDHMAGDTISSPVNGLSIGVDTRLLSISSDDGTGQEDG